MAPATFTSLVMAAIAMLLLTMAGWAWFGDWEPRSHAPRTAEDRVRAEVEALRRAIEAYEREQQSR